MTQLRTPTLDDLVIMGKWRQDPEILALDPIAGPAVEPIVWSIYTSIDDTGCESLIGCISIYNRKDLMTEMGICIGVKFYWGKGHGAKAVKMVIEECWGMGFNFIHLKVLPSNLRAIRCYMKCGFVGRELFYLDGLLFLKMVIRRR